MTWQAVAVYRVLPMTAAVEVAAGRQRLARSWPRERRLDSLRERRSEPHTVRLGTGGLGLCSFPGASRPNTSQPDSTLDLLSRTEAGAEMNRMEAERPDTPGFRSENSTDQQDFPVSPAADGDCSRIAIPGAGTLGLFRGCSPSTERISWLSVQVQLGLSRCRGGDWQG
jgi:hypothetical protein